MTRRIAICAAMLLCLAACARKTELTPAAGEQLPPAPYGRSERLTSSELLELPPLAAPQRSVELRRESEVRADDPFDLPPQD